MRESSINPGLLLLAGLLSLAGCTLIPDTAPPEAVMPERYPQRPTGDAQAADTLMLDELSWRDDYLDDRLQKLIATGLENNTHLQRASLRIEEARAGCGIQGSLRYPEIAAEGSYTRQKTHAAGTCEGGGTRFSPGELRKVMQTESERFSPASEANNASPSAPAFAAP